MTNIIIIVILALIIAGAGAYVFNEKRRGKKCIGCPYSDSCGQKGRCNGFK